MIPNELTSPQLRSLICAAEAEIRALETQIEHEDRQNQFLRPGAREQAMMLTDTRRDQLRAKYLVINRYRDWLEDLTTVAEEATFGQRLSDLIGVTEPEPRRRRASVHQPLTVFAGPPTETQVDEAAESESEPQESFWSGVIGELLTT